jgi:hypothetical protein
MDKFINMEKRHSKRIINMFEADLISRNENCVGLIENISEYGLFFIASPTKEVTTFIPETIFKLNFQPPKEKKINLQCEVRWVHINKIPIHGLRYRIGLEIIDPPSEYKEFYNTLEQVLFSS